MRVPDGLKVPTDDARDPPPENYPGFFYVAHLTVYSNYTFVKLLFLLLSKILRVAFVLILISLELFELNAP